MPHQARVDALGSIHHVRVKNVEIETPCQIPPDLSWGRTARTENSVKPQGVSELSQSLQLFGRRHSVYVLKFPLDGR